MSEKNSGLEVVGYLRASVHGKPEWSEDCVCEQAIYPNWDGDESVSMPICRLADAQAVIVQRDARIAELEAQVARLGNALNAENGATFMGEPLRDYRVLVSQDIVHKLHKASGCAGPTRHDDVLNAALAALKAQQGESGDE